MTIKQTKAQIKERDKENAINFLASHVKPGDRLYGVIKHITPSAAKRMMRFFVIEPYRETFTVGDELHREVVPYDGHRLLDITPQIVDGLGYLYNRRYSGIELEWIGGDEVAENLFLTLYDPKHNPRIYYTNLTN